MARLVPCSLLLGVGSENEITRRLLSPREEARVGHVLGLAVAEIRERIETGEDLREDGFFDSGESGSSDATEVAENVLLKAQREPEEKKLAYMAHLLANIAFDSRVSAAMAHQITKAAEQLTYRQLCMLKLASVAGHLTLREADYRNHGAFSMDLYEVLYELQELHRREYLVSGSGGNLGLTDIYPAAMTLQALGGDIFRLMHLRSIPTEEIEPIARQLR